MLNSCLLGLICIFVLLQGRGRGRRCRYPAHVRGTLWECHRRGVGMWNEGCEMWNVECRRWVLFEAAEAPRLYVLQWPHRPACAEQGPLLEARRRSAQLSMLHGGHTRRYLLVVYSIARLDDMLVFFHPTADRIAGRGLRVILAASSSATNAGAEGGHPSYPLPFPSLPFLYPATPPRPKS